MTPRTEADWWRLIGEAYELAAYGKEHPQVDVFDHALNNPPAWGLCILTDYLDDTGWIAGPMPTEDMGRKMAVRLEMLDPQLDFEHHAEHEVNWPSPWWWERTDSAGLLERADACYLLAAIAASER